MELSAVLTLRDRLSAQMERAGKSVSAMTEKVNESRAAIKKIAETQNIHLSMHSNISETVAAARTSITSLQHTISQKELALQAKVDLDDLNNETIQAKLKELGSFLDKNAEKTENYKNQLAILKQKQAEFTNTTKGSVKLGVEQSIENLEQKLADIEAAKQQFAEWQQIHLDYNELEVARSELSTLEHALENLNHTNIAVRAYLDFKTEALKQVYDIEEKLKSIGKKIISPIIKLKDQATEKIQGIKKKAKQLVQERFAPVISAIDKAKSVMSSVRTGLAKIAGTVAYPVIKLKDAATNLVTKIKNKLKIFSREKTTHEVNLKAQQVFNTIQKINTKLHSLGAKAGTALAKAGSKIGTTLEGTAKKITKGFAVFAGAATVAISGVGAASVKVGSQFEASMSQVAATMGMTAEEANYSNETYAKLANIAKEMGATTKFSASESAEALNYLALAGYDADKACDALPTILNLAAAGGMELAAASDMITDSMSALGIAATQENLTAFGDQMAKAAQKSNTSVAQLGEAILTVGGTAKSLAGGTTELNTLLGIIADNGVKGAEGGTKLRNILLSLQSPTAASAKKLKALGVEVYDAQGKMRPMNEVLSKLNTSMEHMTDQQKDNALSTIFNKTDLKSVKALLSGMTAELTDVSSVLKKNYNLKLDTKEIEHFSKLLKTSNGETKVVDTLIKKFGLSSKQAGETVKDLQKSIPRFDVLSGWIEDSNGAMQDMAETMSNNLQGRITEFKSALEGAGIAIYEALGSSNLKDLVKEASGWIGELTKATEEDGIDGLVGAIGSVFAKIITKITSMSPQILQAGIGIVNHLISGIKNHLPQMINGITKTGTIFLEGILQLMPELLLTGIDMTAQLAKGIAEQVPNLVDSGTKSVEKLAKGLIAKSPMMIHVAIKVITSLSTSLSKNMQPMLTAALKILKTLAQGFMDVIPILLPVVIQIIQDLADFITKNLASLLEVALDIILTLVQGLKDSIPLLIPVVIQILDSFVQFINENLTNILDAALDILVELGKGFITCIPELLPAIITILNAITQFFQENLDLILKTALDILKALADGLINHLPELVSAAVMIITTLAQFLFDNLPTILEEGLQIILSLIQGITNNIPQLVEGATQIITGLVTFLIENFPAILEAAGEIVLALIKGLIEAIPHLVDGTLELVDAIIDTISHTNWLEVGIDLIKGIGEGLVEGVTAIGQTIGKVASSIVGKFKSFLGIHSPSTVMKAEVGLNVGAGVAEGLKETKAKINKEVGNLANGMTVTMRTNLEGNVAPILQADSFLRSTKPEVQKVLEPQLDLFVEPTKPKKSKEFSANRDRYQELEIAQPIYDTKENNIYSSTTENKNQKQSSKKYYIEKLIENVTITGEMDVDKLIEQIMEALANDIEETEENMGGEAWI